MRLIRHLLIAAALVAAVAPPALAGAPGYLFPVVGGASYFDDFGDPRPQGHHEGNDLMAPRGTPLVAVQDGVVTLSSGSRSGFMITLRSSTREFYYIHLNNDRRGNDGRGGPGTAYARGLRSGMRVRAGEVIGYLGDSGDAEYTVPHLHFEEHLTNGTVLNPYRQLRAAPVLLFGRPLSAVGAIEASPVALDATGRLAWIAEDDDGIRIGLRLQRVRVVDGPRLPSTRLLVLRASEDVAAQLDQVSPGTVVAIRTAAAIPTLGRQTLRPGAWQAAKVLGIAGKAPVAP